MKLMVHQMILQNNVTPELTRLYTGTGAFDIVGKRKNWYIASGVILAIAILSIIYSRI